MIRVEETGQIPSEKLMQDMGKLIDEMISEGSADQHRGAAPLVRRRARALSASESSRGPTGPSPRARK
jgi:hypothetical protein